MTVYYVKKANIVTRDLLLQVDHALVLTIAQSVQLFNNPMLGKCLSWDLTLLEVFALRVINVVMAP
jgi:hypothetical protein